MQVDLIITNAKQLLTLAGSEHPHCMNEMNDLGLINNGAIAIKQGIIQDIGNIDFIINKYQTDKFIDANNGVVTPGFVDPHTHPVFLNTREDEFALRLAGKSYVDIAKAGGGIRSTIASTRSASYEALYYAARKRVEKMISQGTTTLEAKSGYGLTTDSELMQLEIINALQKDLPVDIIATFMGAHEYPNEYKDNHWKYINILCEEMLPAVKQQGIARFCDIFTEAHVYSIEESRRILGCAKALGFDLKMHADEIEPIGGAELAAEMRCISADHLGATSDKGIISLKDAGVIPVLLPATLFSLKSKQYARARKMIEYGLPVALASDFNPGSCNCDSQAFIISLSCLMMDMTVEEAITATTINAAHAIGMQDKIGSLEVGKQADILIWDIPSYNFIPYHLGSSYLKMVIKKGEVIFVGQ